MAILYNATELEELGEDAKSEKEAFEAARREVKDWDHRSAVHYYRLGHALTLAKARIGRGKGRPGNFRSWHVELRIEPNMASRAMRLYHAASEDGGEEALAGLGWWQALKHYEIISDEKDFKHSEARPTYRDWDSPGRQYASLDSDDDHETDDSPSPPNPALHGDRDTASFEGFRCYLARQLVACGATEAQAESILDEEYDAIHESLMAILREKLSGLVEARVTSGVYDDLPF